MIANNAIKLSNLRTWKETSSQLGSGGWFVSIARNSTAYSD